MATSLRSMNSIWSGFKVFWAHTIDEYGPNMMDFFDPMKMGQKSEIFDKIFKIGPRLAHCIGPKTLKPDPTLSIDLREATTARI